MTRADHEFREAWQAAIDLLDADEAMKRGGGSHFIRMMTRKRDAATQKLTPGAKAKAIERKRPVIAAMLTELRAGETNLTRIVQRVREVTGVKISPITARRLLKERFGITGKPGRQKRN